MGGAFETEEADKGWREEISIDERTACLFLQHSAQINEKLGEGFWIEESIILFVFSDDDNSCREERMIRTESGINVARGEVNNMVWRALMQFRIGGIDAIFREDKHGMISST